MKSKFFSVLFVLSAIFLAFGISVFAQGTTSRVTGIVTDSSGAVVPDAKITLINQGTNSSLTTQTSNGGVYVFDLVQPGTYTVTVEKTGFKKFVSTNNPVLVNQPATINVAMQIGDVSATVTPVSAKERRFLIC
ncbi:MAG TPA: carboxypeptidase-like regulatory domain-containing protein [Pyrinomonadaceae bacterium]|nr:carboxypeptidase-like regulatory domain-containing protein [Pyrinomonadaceae bacterium]